MSHAWLLLATSLSVRCAAAPQPLGGHALMPSVAAPERPSRKSELVLRCDPQDAEVVLDGVPQGTCADFDGARGSLKLGGGARRVEVKKRGFSPWSSWLEADRTRVAMDVTLIPNTGGAP